MSHLLRRRLGLLIILGRECCPLGVDPLDPPLARSLGLRTLGVHFILEHTFASCLGLGLVDLETLSVREAEIGL